MKKQAELTFQDVMALSIAGAALVATLWAIWWVLRNFDTMNFVAVAVGAALAGVPFWLARRPMAIVTILLLGILIVLL